MILVTWAFLVSERDDDSTRITIYIFALGHARINTVHGDHQGELSRVVLG